MRLCQVYNESYRDLAVVQRIAVKNLFSQVGGRSRVAQVQA